MKQRFSAIVSRLRSGHRRPPRWPLWAVSLVVLACAAAAYYVQDFRFDASADTLMAQGDPELAYYRQVSNRFGVEGFLVLTYMPTSGPLIAPETLSDLERLVSRLRNVEGVRSVDSILDVPLLKSPPVPLGELATDYRTLQSPDVDLDLAAKELTQSPVFRNLLISADGEATAIRIELASDRELDERLQQRNRLRQVDNRSEQQQEELDAVEAAYREAYADYTAERDRAIAQIRDIRGQLGDDVIAHLGGVPVIASDMIDYVQQDVVTFGSLVVVLIAVMLFAIFRQWRWVLLPLLSTGVTVLLTMGALGFLKQPTTVISSNFIALLVIFTIAFAIHLIVRYREFRGLEPDSGHAELVSRTLKDKLAPCVYMALTTMVAFASLITSDIVPVMDFGWIMSLGILISLLVTYSFFAGLMMLLPGAETGETRHRKPMVTRALGALSVNHTTPILIVTTTLFAVAALGMERLSLDNRFVNYFRSGSEVRESLTFIDEHFGGTIPMEIILRLEPFQASDAEGDDDIFADPEDEYPERYWYTPGKLQYLAEMHEYLETRPAIGKILSLHNFAQVARDLRDGDPLDAMELVTLLGAIPESLREELIEPYADPEAGLLRITTRLHEIDVDYSLDTLIEEIETYAAQNLDLENDAVRVTGMAVLFNDMLEQLFESQRSTLLFVMLAILVMFILLLRSIKLAVLGLLPNALVAATALGFMGFAGIPLDVMTITIAAVIVGIGVDDAIHYLHRFRREYARTNNARTAVLDSHDSIGHALYYTTITVVIGFSVLGFSNFVPTIHFGLMTAMAMILALLANLAMLPSLLILAFRRQDEQRAS